MLVCLSRPSFGKMEVKRKSCQISEIESREIGSKGNDKGDLSEMVKIR